MQMQDMQMMVMMIGTSPCTSPSHHKKHGKKVDENDSQSKENSSNENVILKNLMKNNMITKQCEYCTEFPDDYSVRNMSNPAKYVTNL